MHCLDYLTGFPILFHKTRLKPWTFEEAAGSKQEQHINIHIKHFISERCSNLLKDQELVRNSTARPFAFLSYLFHMSRLLPFGERLIRVFPDN